MPITNFLKKVVHLQIYIMLYVCVCVNGVGAKAALALWPLVFFWSPCSVDLPAALCLKRSTVSCWGRSHDNSLVSWNACWNDEIIFQLGPCSHKGCEKLFLLLGNSFYRWDYFLSLIWRAVPLSISFVLVALSLVLFELYWALTAQWFFSRRLTWEILCMFLSYSGLPMPTIQLGVKYDTIFSLSLGYPGN
jgi:hypothetical protein